MGPLLFKLNLMYFVGFADHRINMFAPWQVQSDQNTQTFSTVNDYKTWG